MPSLKDFRDAAVQSVFSGLNPAPLERKSIYTHPHLVSPQGDSGECTDEVSLGVPGARLRLDSNFERGLMLV